MLGFWEYRFRPSTPGELAGSAPEESKSGGTFAFAARTSMSGWKLRPMTGRPPPEIPVPANEMAGPLLSQRTGPNSWSEAIMTAIQAERPATEPVRLIAVPDHEPSPEQVTTSTDELAAAFEAAVLSGLLRCTAAEAAPIVAELDAGVFRSPCHRYGFEAVRAALAAGIDPTPLAAVDSATEIGVERPPAWHNSAVCELTAVACSPAGPALPQLRWHADRLAAHAARRDAESVLLSGLDQTGRAYGLAELAALLRGQADRLQALAGVGR